MILIQAQEPLASSNRKNAFLDRVNSKWRSRWTIDYWAFILSPFDGCLYLF